MARYALGLVPVERDKVELWDLGCGKGRVVLLAAEFGFRRSVGVEVNEALLSVADSNVERARPHLPPTAEINLIRASAADLIWPDTPLVVFMFNPFGGDVFGRVVTGLESRVAKGAASVHIIYVNPRERYRLDTSPHFRSIAYERLPSSWSFVIYEAIRPDPLEVSSNPPVGRAT